MPKKPFSPEEVRAQREKIMAAASYVMSEFGFHHLSMRKLASQLGMTASNIYNYFSSKEVLFMSTRKRGFELFFATLRDEVGIAETPKDALVKFASHMVSFSQVNTGYYQLMFQPPLLSLGEEHKGLSDLEEQLSLLSQEWQKHIISLLCDAMPKLASSIDEDKKRAALLFISNLHGMIDLYYYKSVDYILDGCDSIPEEQVVSCVDRCLNALTKENELHLA